MAGFARFKVGMAWKQIRSITFLRYILAGTKSFSHIPAIYSTDACLASSSFRENLLAEEIACGWRVFRSFVGIGTASCGHTNILAYTFQHVRWVGGGGEKFLLS